VTVLAQGALDRYRGSKDICKQVLTEAGAAPK
jgi:hypothetical protein